MCSRYCKMCFNMSTIDITSVILSSCHMRNAFIDSKIWNQKPLLLSQASLPQLQRLCPCCVCPNCNAGVWWLCHLHALNVQWSSIPSKAQKIDHVSFQGFFFKSHQFLWNSRQRLPLVLASVNSIPSFLGKLKMNCTFHCWVRPDLLNHLFRKVSFAVIWVIINWPNS